MAILETNITLNEIKNIKVEPYALSNEIKKSRIYDRWDVNRGAASLIEPDISTDSYDITETTFTNYFDKNEKIKLVKIDVEGYEYNVLEGARQFILNSKLPPSLIVEFSSNRINTFGEDTYPLFLFLKELKIYRLFKAVKGKENVSKLIEITNEKNLPKHDNVFCFTDEHLSKLPKGLFQTMPNKK
jgi:FkbM family methyltransferase